MARLNDKQRDDITNAYHIGKSIYQIAKDFEVSTATVHKLVKDLTQNNGITKYHNYIDKPFKGNKDGFVYVIYFKDTASKFFYKIGLATDVRSRIKQHQTSNPFNIYIAISYYVENMRIEEKILHEMFDQERILGEWFELKNKDLEAIKERSLRIINGI